MALVDAFLIARKFIPSWKSQEDYESTFFWFLRELLPTIADANEAIEARQLRTKCNQVCAYWEMNCERRSQKGQEYAKQANKKDAAITASSVRL